MRRADPSIILLASGNMPEPMDLTGEMRAKDVDNMKAVEGTPEDWTGGEIEHCWGNFSGITQHWYARSGQRFDVQKAKQLPLDAPTEAGYDKVEQTPLEFARYPANIVQLRAQEWHRYEQRFPQLAAKHIFLSIDEYAYFGGSFNRVPDMKMALAYGMILNEMLRHTDFLRMSARPWVSPRSTTRPTAAVLNTTGLVYKLYGDTFVPGSIPVALTGNSPQPVPQYPVGGDQPETNSGSPTYPLDMFAALTPDRKTLTLAVVNATDAERSFNLNVAGLQVQGQPTVWQITGKNLQAADQVGQTPQVTSHRSTGERHAAAADGRADQHWRVSVRGGAVTAKHLKEGLKMRRYKLLVLASAAVVCGCRGERTNEVFLREPHEVEPPWRGNHKLPWKWQRERRFRRLYPPYTGELAAHCRVEGVIDRRKGVGGEEGFRNWFCSGSASKGRLEW